MSKLVRVGFVGTGGIAEAHINRLREIPENQIVAVCDIRRERAEAIAKPLNAAVYSDAQLLLKQARLDALYVCVPPYAHADIEINAARKGLHLFVEKPVNLYLEQARAVCKEIKQAGVMSQAGYVLRYFASSLQLKKLLADKVVGSAHISRWGGIPGMPWWSRYDQSGGQFVEQTTHQLDLLRWVLGEVAAVSACCSLKRVLKDRPEVTIADSQAILLQFKSGAVATVNTSCACGKTGVSSVDLVIKDAKVSWRGDGLKLDPEGAYTLPAPPLETPSIDAAFIRAIVSGNPALLYSPYDDALKSLAVTLAANKSAEQGGALVNMDEFLPHVE